MKKCENCGNEHDGSYGSGRFCSSKCARSYSRKNDKGGTKTVQCINCGKDIKVGKRSNPKQCKCDECRKKPKYIPKEKRKYCKNCGKKLEKTQRIYCNHICQQEYQYKEYIKKWKNGEVDGTKSNGNAISSYVYRYIKERDGHKCSICGNTEWMDKHIPLILDHIDGNSENNDEWNLRYVCGNCDMQLPTYKARNIGSGRHYRKQRYKEGKSY